MGNKQSTMDTHCHLCGYVLSSTMVHMPKPKPNTFHPKCAKLYVKRLNENEEPESAFLDRVIGILDAGAKDALDRAKILLQNRKSVVKR